MPNGSGVWTSAVDIVEMRHFIHHSLATGGLACGPMKQGRLRLRLCLLTSMHDMDVDVDEYSHHTVYWSPRRLCILVA